MSMMNFGDTVIDSHKLHFVPLGGSGEFGMNANLYFFDGKILMVDLGMGFADDWAPGVELILPDLTALEPHRKQLAGLVITHAHEDHIGAIPHLWPRLQCPIYATPFAAALIKEKLNEAGLASKAKIHIVPLSGKADIGPFNVRYVDVAHSIPEASALIITTSAGRIVHTGDWKLDPDPVVGRPTDETCFRAAGTEGVLAMVGDSTNAMSNKYVGSESTLAQGLADVFAAAPGRVAVACFSSNVARMRNVALAARQTGRHVAIAGRSLKRIYQIACNLGYMEGLEPFLNDEQAGFVPPEKIVLMLTGSQGEPRAALNRIAEGDHREIVLDPGDTVVFSSRPIPGNEKAIGRLQSRLMKLGCKIVTASDATVHVSGHGSRDDIAQMYQWVRPKIAIPVHGEHYHLVEHANLAQSCQVPHGIVPENGDIICIDGEQVSAIGSVDLNVLAVDGNRVIQVANGPIRERARLMREGSIHATVVVDRKGQLLADVQITMTGVFTDDEQVDAEDDLLDQIEDNIDQMEKSIRLDDEAMKEAVRLVIRRQVKAKINKKPVISVALVRVG